MSVDISPRSVRFTNGEEGDILDTLKGPRVMERPHIQTIDSGESGSSGDSQDDQLVHDVRLTPTSNSVSSLEQQRPPIISMNSSMRSLRSNGESNGTYPRVETPYS